MQRYYYVPVNKRAIMKILAVYIKRSRQYDNVRVHNCTIMKMRMHLLILMRSYCHVNINAHTFSHDFTIMIEQCRHALVRIVSWTLLCIIFSWSYTRATKNTTTLLRTLIRGNTYDCVTKCLQRCSWQCNRVGALFIYIYIFLRTRDNTLKVIMFMLKHDHADISETSIRD